VVLLDVAADDHLPVPQRCSDRGLVQMLAHVELFPRRPRRHLPVIVACLVSRLDSQHQRTTGPIFKTSQEDLKQILGK